MEERIQHTVGPVWYGGGDDEDRLLASCYRKSLALAKDRGLRSVAFPSISTGAYRFPLERAAKIAVGEVRRFLAENKLPERVVFVCFDAAALNAYTRLLASPADG